MPGVSYSGLYKKKVVIKQYFTFIFTSNYFYFEWNDRYDTLWKLHQLCEWNRTPILHRGYRSLDNIGPEEQGDQ